MKQKTRTSILLSALTMLVVAGVTGCGQSTENAQPAQRVTKENPAMRSEVPLIRPVSLDKAGEIVNLEFELPPPIENASSTLLLGLRVVTPDTEAGLKRSSEIIRSHLSARVRLLRIEQDSITQIPLFRNTPDLQDRVAIGADGAVPGVTSSDVERSQLENAGLFDDALFHDVLMFAGTQDATPGHYRLTIQLDQDHPELDAEPVELLIAYMGRGK
ncbi:TPA: hypothetical protein QDZ10_003007 [Stenotrophomonas maltophilia]|nr:hypothetical protein [Stenotrophomonas maltophilia]